MSRKHGWLIVLVVVSFLVAACGPQMATPTPDDETGVETPAATATETGKATEPAPPASGEMLVNSDDWHILGSPDAEVTIVEFADFQ